MSADNYVQIEKDGRRGFKWAVFFASTDHDQQLATAKWRTGWATVLDAYRDAKTNAGEAEYGISIADNCLPKKPRRA